MLYDFQRLVTKLVRDDSGRLEPADVDEAISLAVIRYSKDRPRQVVEDLTAEGGQSLAVPESWVLGFSQPVQVECPIGDVPPTLIEAFQVYATPTGEAVLLDDVLSDGDEVRLTYTLFHALDDATDTIPLGDREAVVCYAAAACLDQLATLAAADGDSTISADAVERGSKAARYAGRAKVMRDRYHDELGLDPKRNGAAGAVVDWDSVDSRGQPRLMHDRRFR